jgi:hypothetical protein
LLSSPGQKFFEPCRSLFAKNLVSSIYLVGALILVITSIPQCLAAGVGLPGFVIAIIVIGVGLGGVKACMSPFLGRSRFEIGVVTKNAADLQIDLFS